MSNQGCEQKPDSRAIRAWARGRGIDVGGRGRVPIWLVGRYNRALLKGYRADSTGDAPKDEVTSATLFEIMAQVDKWRADHPNWDIVFAVSHKEDPKNEG